MLNEQEKNVLLHFLSVLNDHKIKSLANSITHGRLQSKTREDAISCLLLHSESLISVLNNKKVSPSCLLNYLHQMKAPSPGNAQKETLLRLVYGLWKLPFPNDIQNNVATMQIQGIMNIPNNTSYQQQPQLQTNQFNAQSMQPSPSLLISNPGSVSTLQYAGQNALSIQPPMQPNNALQPYDTTPRTSTSQYSQAIASYQLLKEVSSLAFDDFMVNFAKTFYELLNSPHTGEYLHGLNRSHFFDECKMIIEIKGGEEEIEQIGESAIQVLKLLSDLRRDHQLAFSPNLTPEGVRGKTDSHGLIYAVASGTLHQGRGQLVGVFEQSFILRKDPFEQNSCKIADSTLILRSNKSVNSYSQLLLPSSKRTNERNLAIQSTPSSNQLQITNFGS